nr:hypothetical protein [Tanacetum cinerariifolium]
APPSPDYMPGPEEPEQAPPSPNYIPEDDEMDVEADEEEKEEEHPAPADSVVVAPTAADQAPSAEETKPFETDESTATPPPHPAYRTTARISIPAPVPMPGWTDSEVVRLLAISSPPTSPLSPWSSPPLQIPFPPLPPILSPPSPILAPAPPPSPIRSLGYRAAMIRLRDEVASTSPLPSQLPSASRREDRPEVTLPPRKRLDIALDPRYEVGESSSAAAARPAGGQISEIRELQAADRRRQTVILELLSNCTAENQVKFATCTLHSVALTWWNTHVQTVGHEAAYGMSWKTLMKMMTDKYFPRNKIRKLEMEIWELKVKELALLCGRMFYEEADKIEKYVGGLLDMIHGSVVASKPKTMQEAIEIATELMDKKVRTFAERETASKRKLENTSRTTRNQQQQQQHSNKRQNTGRVYTAASGGKKQYGGSKHLCTKCNYHHDGPCAPKCHNCNKFGHFARDCRV